MKTRFNTFDIICGVTELQKLIGYRVNQIYDIDNKTFLIKLHGGGDSKIVLLIESGNRFHTTVFEWPKNVVPSGCTMKLRKHLKNKRLEKFQQIGVDRIVDLEFGTGEACYHIFLELYDRGNIVLTDYNLTILYLLRPHSDGEEIRFAVREKYPLSQMRLYHEIPNKTELEDLLNNAKSESLKATLMSALNCGPALVDHILTKYNFNNYVLAKKLTSENTSDESKIFKRKKYNTKPVQSEITKNFEIEKDFNRLMEGIQEINLLISNAKKTVSNGYIIQKEEIRPSMDSNVQERLFQNIEFHPYLFEQFLNLPVLKYETFMEAVDEFYSSLEGQRIDFRALQQEKEIYKKLTNVKMDHERRLQNLSEAQKIDEKKSYLITCNQELIDNAILAIRSLLAAQMSWSKIKELVKDAQSRKDPVASTIKQLKLDINHICMILSDPYDDNEEEESEKTLVDIDLGLSAWANARKYYDQKRTAALKEHKTVSASEKALKSAERKTKETLKNVKVISSIMKARKIYWFEKFYWFISSENYLVIAGRDAQQNELIVKRYMRPTDVYVHAEIQGASSVVIRNPGGIVPPKTLVEAGIMAISYSVAWDAKVTTNAYWVYSNQVSKTAPTGEFLGTGSFMIRGKKNFLPSTPLVMGISLLFKLEDSFVERHRGERKMRLIDDIDTSKQPQESVKELSPSFIDSLAAEMNDYLNINEADDSNDSESHVIDNIIFPDSEVTIEHDTGKVKIQSEKLIKNEIVENTEKILSEETIQIKDDNEETIVITTLPQRIKQQSKVKKRKDKKIHKNETESELKSQPETSLSTNNAQLKRGQKGKLKKMKLKYKNQDDEDRLLRMKILQPAGPLAAIPETQSELKADENASKNEVKKTETKHQAYNKENDYENDDINTGTDIDVLDTLTGDPYEDDELLFAIPVVAPYQALQNVKYKVKLMPGTGKRGRAAKTALEIFQRDKNCTSREKDLIKQVKDETVARNIPGKVKLTTVQFQKLKK